MEKHVKDLMRYLDRAHSVFHAVEELRLLLEEAGYIRLQEAENWTLEAGGKYYMTRGGSALMAFRIPEGEPAGFMLSASHSDRPTFKLKENGELTGAYTRLSVERYGGMLIAPWLDRPLGVAGRVTVQTGTGVENRLVDIDRDLLLIPNVAIHMNHAANDGFKWDLTRDVLPLAGGKNAAGKLEKLVQKAAGGKVLGSDLFLYVRDKARIWGVDKEYLSAPALDDLACVWCCARGFLDATDSAAIPVLCVFDNEEVGSASRQGADSRLLELLLQRICHARGLDEGRMLAQSMLVSADNAHALHPNRPELADPKNAPILGGGVAIKFNSTLRYTSDGLSAGLLRAVCERAGVKTQTYYNRADMPGGSTLGCISIGHVSVPSVDIGIPQLAMHSSYETCALTDVTALLQTMTAWYGSGLKQTADGVYTLI